MTFNWKKPDYMPVFQQRYERLAKIRANPKCLPAMFSYYRTHPARFISDWGCTSDPRNVEVGLPVVVPFLLFKRQREWVDWVMDSWRNRRPGVSPKSRESGLSWLAMATACTLCLFEDNMAIGFGSRLAEYVDKIGAPKSLFWKGRKFLTMLPPEFRRGFNSSTDAPHMRIHIHQTGSIITGEGGDNLGRGDRTGLYFVDESSHLEHPEVTDAALSQTTNCRIDISTANGIGNPFHRKVVEWPRDRVFEFHWRDDPRKDEVWYAKQCADLDPVTVAQEIDIDFAASVEGVLIPSAWVQAAVDAGTKVGHPHPSGLRFGALDVADEGKDRNAFCGAHGWLVECLEEWSGKGDDIFGTTEKCFGLCDGLNYTGFRYDADGLGASVRGDARVINERRRALGQKTLTVDAFRGSHGVVDPTGEDVMGRKNEDYFANEKAQSWWALRERFKRTFRWVVEGVPCPVDQIIALSPRMPLLRRLTLELSQPTYSVNGVGKIIVDKAPDGARSPNLADAVMIRFGRVPARVVVSDAALANMARNMAGWRR